MAKHSNESETMNSRLEPTPLAYSVTCGLKKESEPVKLYCRTNAGREKCVRADSG